jgi:NAD(P)H-dependent FMN reductase
MNQVTSKPKTHRSSFNDFSTPTHKLNERQQDNLKTRFDKALEKTQEAFKIYDKYFKRNRRF